MTNYNYLDFFDPRTFKVETSWKVFASLCLPNNVSQIQHDETKKAFYCGFLECFKIMSDYAGGLEEDQACELFNRLADESRRFMDEMLEKQGASKA